MTANQGGLAPNAKRLHLRAWLPCIFCIQCCNWLEMLGVAVAAKFGKWSTSAQEDIHGPWTWTQLG